MLRYQVEFCARWLANHLDYKLAKYNTQPGKLSFDRLSVRVDKHRFLTVQSAFAVRSDRKTSFLIALVTEVSLHIGWTTKQSEFDDQTGMAKIEIPLQ